MRPWLFSAMRRSFCRSLALLNCIGFKSVNSVGVTCHASFDSSKRKTSTYGSTVIRRNFDEHNGFSVFSREHHCQRAYAWPHGAMASVANPHATNAAIEMLAEGGHAVDAAIAAHLVLGLVEAQSSGIGGGGFMLVFERGERATTFYDGRETAPANATPDMFMQDEAAMPYVQAWQSGRSVGVPGVVALYKKAHEKHGRLAWSRLFGPAIRLAEAGFEVSPRLADMLVGVAKYTRLDENPGECASLRPFGAPQTLDKTFIKRDCKVCTRRGGFV